jgi:hypothetical protein
MSLIRLNFNTQGLCGVFMEAGAKTVDVIDLYHGSEWDFELVQAFRRKPGEPLLDLFNRAVAAAQAIQTAHSRKHAHKPEPTPAMPLRLVLVDMEKRARDAAREMAELADASDTSPDDFVRLASSIELSQKLMILPWMGDEGIFNHMEAALDDRLGPIQKLSRRVWAEITAFGRDKGILQ